MAQELTIETQLKAQGLEKQPNIVLTIDGYDDDIWAAVDVEKLARYGEDGIVYGLAGLVYGGFVKDVRSRDYLSLKGTSTKITQQLEVDKGGTGSIQTFNVKLLDPNGELTNKFAPSVTTPDILAVKARISFLFQGTAFPEDAITLFVGIITDISFAPGSVTIRVSHPDQLKRKEIFTVINHELDGAINNSVTTIALNSVERMVEPATDFETFIRVDDEIIQYTGISGNNLTGCTRGALNTIAASHDDESETETMYALSGNGIEIALKLMLSNPRKLVYASLMIDELIDPVDRPPLSVEPVLNFRGALFKGRRLQDEIGLVVGDIVKTFRVDTLNPPDLIDDGVPRTVTEIRQTDQGTEVYYSARLNAAVMKQEFTSKYNVWPIGLSMDPTQVDIDQHERIDSLYSSSLPAMHLYMKEGASGIDIIEKDLMLPNALYSVPRKGRSSIGLTLPPIAESNVQTVNETNVTNPTELIIKRSLNTSFYNQVVYRYDEDSLEDDFLTGLVVVDEDSVARISFEDKPLKIDARGFRKGNGTENLIRRQAERILDRYKFAADRIDNVKVTLGTGFNIDVTDTVIFGSPALQIADGINASREFQPRVMECINKEFDLKGRVTLSLLDTSFSTEGRYGIIGPSSFVSSYASNLLVLKRSFSTIASEQIKWTDYVGENILIRNEDFTIQEVVTLSGLVPGNQNAIAITTPTISITENMIVELAPYDDAGPISKAVHPYFTPQIEITDVTSTLIVEVDLPSVLFVGCVVEVASPDYSNISREVKVDAINGNEVTFDRELSYTPSVGDFINLIGFVSDESFPYRIL